MAGQPGRSGRKRKPAALKHRDGTYRADRDGKPEDKLKFEAIVIKPEFRDKVADEFWDEHVTELIKLKVVSGQDVPRLQMMCEQWALVRRLTKLYEDDPLCKDTRIAWAETCKMFAQATIEFGFTPSARSRMLGPVQETKSAIKGRKRD